jgi:protein-L-isoaspartate(D-aspartate) O-methyltransferase
MKTLRLAYIIFYCLSGPVLADISGDSAKFEQSREQMVRYQIEQRGISDQKVLAAMRTVPRHLFVPRGLRSNAYADRPLPIGEGQTISQPYIVALMTESLRLDANSRILEIGTGSGYQAAILAQITAEVYTIEIKEKLYKKATEVLKTLDFTNVKTRRGDGYYGWEEQAPFDAIMITAAVDHVPPPLIRQLKNGGKLILPLGHPFNYQYLVLVTKKGDDIFQKNITGVLFVPMTGHALRK